MNNKFQLKKQYIDCKIITKDSSGNDVLVDKGNFNDHYAKLMFATGQGHMIEVNKWYDETLEEKKTFHQLSENVIALTYNPMEKGGEKQEPTVKQRKSRSDAGKPRMVKK